MLDSRKSELLSKMAIDVWRLRESNDTQSIESIGPDSTVNTVNQVAGEAAPEQVGVESLSLASDSVPKSASLEVIAELARNCTKCSLSENAKHMPFPEKGIAMQKWGFRRRGSWLQRRSTRAAFCWSGGSIARFNDSGVRYEARRCVYRQCCEVPPSG